MHRTNFKHIEPQHVTTTSLIYIYHNNLLKVQSARKTQNLNTSTSTPQHI